MIKTYKYIKTPHGKLHEFVMAFFNRIEFETGVFDNSFYDKEFYDELVSHHIKILGKRFKDIYAITKTWSQANRTKMCLEIRNSNQIKNVCDGTIKPLKSSAISAPLVPLLHDLFISLYEDVIKGKYFIAKYGSLKDQYHTIRKDKANDFEFCPACGIVEMKNSEDKKKDQHDHYFPKDVYPFSSVNFENLVPVCIDCNSIEVKSNKDVLKYSGLVFYPFDEKHKGIDIEVSIKKNSFNDLSKIQWHILYSNKDAKNGELQAWKDIYNIEDRHQTHVIGNINSWYGFFDKTITDKDIISEIPEYEKRKNSYLNQLKNRKVLEYKAMKMLIDSFDKPARVEARRYSRF